MVRVPKKWDNVTLRGYIAFMKSLNKETKSIKETVRLQMERVCHLTGCEPEEASKVTTEEYKNVNSLVKSELPTKLKHFFKHKGIRYRLLYTRELTGDRLSKIKEVDAEMIDGGTYTAVMNAVKRGRLDNTHVVMFNIVEPVKFGFLKHFPFIGWKGYEFKDNEIDQRLEEFKDLTMDIVNPACVFFCHLSKNLTTDLNQYLKEQTKIMEKMTRDLQADLQKDLDGSQ